MTGAKRFVVVFQTVKLALSYIFRRALGYITTVQSVEVGGLRNDDLLRTNLRIFLEKFVFGPHMSTLETQYSHL